MACFIQTVALGKVNIGASLIYFDGLYLENGQVHNHYVTYRTLRKSGYCASQLTALRATPLLKAEDVSPTTFWLSPY